MHVVHHSFRLFGLFPLSLCLPVAPSSMVQVEHLDVRTVGFLTWVIVNFHDHIIHRGGNGKRGIYPLGSTTRQERLPANEDMACFLPYGMCMHPLLCLQDKCTNFYAFASGWDALGRIVIVGFVCLFHLSSFNCD